MATIDELHAALLKADAAGDKASAKVLADHIRSLSAMPAAPAAQPEPSAFDKFKEGAGNLLYGAVKGVADPVYGLSQLALHGANTVSGGRLAGVTKQYDNLINGVEQQYQADTPGSVMAGAGRVLGNLAYPVPPVLKGATLLPRLGNAAITGATVGAAQPVYGSQERDLSSVVTDKPAKPYWEEKAKQIGIGAVAGTALSAGGKVAGAAYNTIRPIVSPSSTAGNAIYKNLVKTAEQEQANGAPVNVQGLTGSDPKAVLANLTGIPEYVPGSLPTTAQVAGSPELVMAEKTLRNTPAYTAKFMTREASNNAARNQVVSNVAQTPEALAAAIKARTDASAPLYNAFNAETLPVDQTLNGLLNTPIGKDATRRAAEIAANKQQPFNFKTPTAEQSVPSAILGADGLPASTSTIPAQGGSIDGSAANLIKMAMDAMKRDTPTAGIASHEAGALRDVRNAFVDHLDSTSPTFQQARQAWAQGSVPVNTMTAGQELQNALMGGALNYAGEVAPTLTKYSGKLKSIMDKQNYPIDSEALASLQNVQKDLQRRSISDSVPKSGSDTVWNAQAPNWLSSQLMGQNLDGNSLLGRGLGAGLGFMSGNLLGGAGGVALVQKGGQWIGNRVNTQLQDAMMNPEVFRTLLQQALDRNAGGNVNNFAPRAAAATGNVFTSDR